LSRRDRIFFAEIPRHQINHGVRPHQGGEKIDMKSKHWAEGPAISQIIAGTFR
jgi:hypothetical protein